MKHVALVSKNRPEHTWSEVPTAARAMAGEVEHFENAFAAYIGAPYAIAFPYSRVALHAALSTLSSPGNEVAITGYTCVVMPHAVVLAGKSPRFVDIDPKTYNAEGSALAAACGVSTSAVVTTAMYGNPVDPQALERLTDRPRLLVEDNALSLHAPFHSRNPLLTAVGIYSFGFNKILSTLSGGMLATFDEAAAKKLRAYRDVQLRQASAKARAGYVLRLVAAKSLFMPVLYSGFDRLRGLPWIAREIDTRSFEQPYFPDDAQVQLHADQAALGLRQLDRADLFLRKRREWAERYFSVLSELRGVLEPMPLHTGSHFSHYTVRIPDRDRRGIREKMKRAGIEVGRTLDYAMSEIPYYAGFPDSCPESRRAAAEILNLPNYPGLTFEAFDRVIEALTRALR